MNDFKKFTAEEALEIYKQKQLTNKSLYVSQYRLPNENSPAVQIKLGCEDELRKYLYVTHRSYSNSQSMIDLINFFRENQAVEHYNRINYSAYELYKENMIGSAKTLLKYKNLPDDYVIPYTDYLKGEKKDVLNVMPLYAFMSDTNSTGNFNLDDYSTIDQVLTALNSGIISDVSYNDCKPLSKSKMLLKFFSNHTREEVIQYSKYYKTLPKKLNNRQLIELFTNYSGKETGEVLTEEFMNDKRVVKLIRESRSRFLAASVVMSAYNATVFEKILDKWNEIIEVLEKERVHSLYELTENGLSGLLMGEIFVLSEDEALACLERIVKYHEPLKVKEITYIVKNHKDLEDLPLEWVREAIT